MDVSSFGRLVTFESAVIGRIASTVGGISTAVVEGGPSRPPCRQSSETFVVACGSVFVLLLSGRYGGLVLGLPRSEEGASDKSVADLPADVPPLPIASVLRDGRDGEVCLLLWSEARRRCVIDPGEPAPSITSSS